MRPYVQRTFLNMQEQDKWMTKKIATHNGNFHADDVFSVALFKIMLTTFDLVRTRDPELIAKADIVIDVGCKDDPDTDRFDHHQQGGAGKRENGIPYSSFGLIWKKYGLKMCQGNREVAHFVDSNLVSTVDAIDCGHVDGEFEGFSLSQAISLFNPTWNEDSKVDICFDEAVNFASRFLERFITSAVAEVGAEKIVAKAIVTAKDPRVIVLKKNVPWKQSIQNLSGEALYTIYPSQTGQWRIQAVPVELGSFAHRKSLPKKWAGLSGKELKAVTGINDAIFCHDGLFTAGVETYESAIKMASIALNE